jgi:hypothetical protein
MTYLLSSALAARRALFPVALVFNLCLIAVFAGYRFRLYEYSTGQGVSVEPSAFSASGIRLNGCLVLRYTSTECHVCASDSIWPTLRDSLERSGCTVDFLQPSMAEPPTKEYVGNGCENRLVSVRPQLTLATRLSGTPTTMIFDGSGALVWQKIGALDEPAASAAASQVHKLGKLKGCGAGVAVSR